MARRLNRKNIENALEFHRAKWIDLTTEIDTERKKTPRNRYKIGRLEGKRRRVCHTGILLRLKLIYRTGEMYLDYNVSGRVYYYLKGQRLPDEVWEKALKKDNEKRRKQAINTMK